MDNTIDFWVNIGSLIITLAMFLIILKQLNLQNTKNTRETIQFATLSEEKISEFDTRLKLLEQKVNMSLESLKMTLDDIKKIISDKSELINVKNMIERLSSQLTNHLHSHSKMEKML